ncbi:type VI secretion system-associated protein [Vibrio navarrensis]|jgi:type VI secretion system protein ImpB|uniref:Type VI secretion protein n=1 Tax=Vibrio navarrensis TaxID=29495 RepID=A0A099MIJ4_9VIBR|nr:type VI secretion system contractile sheath small subunit [Vibrio navarrensis]EGR2796874.1 type VI secretion system contractile sheath small subunit [Vibrio navarrensis]EHA1124172.1 type VI secretion system contractile sheath small subunit [Vibrio navarrensis]EJL6396266.1 type VI secretion system contractile sheath small subunit [Vibrio navarrensis]EJL6400255.1 type VI secretion system contractile sheath small subunit [Vibrio navarrensis]EJL6567859.1 type VI secretion system contractile she
MTSIHSKLSRVRKPRVHITYDVETEGTSLKKELPFVVGVMGDFAGQNTEALKPLKDRRFIQIDRDNFDDVLKKMSPSVAFKVNNTLAGDGSQFEVNLKFQSMKDFEPASIVRQVEPLRQLMDTRNKLRDLMTKVDRSEELENVLEAVLNNTENLSKLADELKIGQEEAQAE